MCQCMLCGCVWCNYCGVPCGGCHEAFCVCSYWICKPDDLRLIDPLCCHICAWDGWGYNCLWEGMICCAPLAVVEWSGLRVAGRVYSDVNKTIVVTNTSPTIMMSPGYNANMGGNVNMNMNMGGNVSMNTNVGGMGMNVNTNVGGMGMNVNTNMGGMGGNVSMNTNMGGMGGNVSMNTNMSGPNMNVNMKSNGANFSAKTNF